MSENFNYRVIEEFMLGVVNVLSWLYDVLVFVFLLMGVLEIEVVVVVVVRVLSLVIILMGENLISEL